MIQSILKKIFGSANERLIKNYKKRVHEINLLEPQLVSLSDEELTHRTVWLKSRLEKGETLDDILVDAFATVREASKRVFGQRHYDVQLIGGMVLHDGRIAEMRTGEGKTLVATLAVYLNALSGKGVHLVTINDYLAKRDADWMGRLYTFLGLSVGCIVHGLTDRQRQENYGADVTYGTNHEFGFDYLRDNMKFRLNDMVQRPFNYAIVDEVDSILIDEARTPLIISGSAEDSSELYQKINDLIPLLLPEDLEKDEKQKNVMLTEQGVEKIESLVMQAGLLKGNSLYDVQNVSIVHHINCALKAHKMFTADVDYMVKDGKVLIIDEFTGRIMEGRRYSEGLHQALEAKENVKIEMENQTLASITYQNFFRLYPKLSGMTGTGATEATEFDEIYKLQVVEIPTNLPVQRIDHDDEVYLTAKDKYAAMIKDIKVAYEKKQPVLVGTTSIEKSEVVSALLTQAGIKHQVLNAKYHEKESSIVALAGRLGAVTVATNMAGRGTDIKLGGNADLQIELELEGMPEGEERAAKEQEIRAQVAIDEQKVKELGGLYVIGTERHESRRIDNQLRGRSGRQGDPGASKFFISLQDDLMRIFGSERLDAMLRRFGVQEGEVISHKMISRSLERAQQKVEARNFDIRKHLLKYDDVMNDQRKIIYEQRRFIMECDSLTPMMKDMREDVLDRVLLSHIPANSLIDEWDMAGLHLEVKRVFDCDVACEEWVKEDTISEHAIKERLLQAVEDHFDKKNDQYGAPMIESAQKTLLLRLLDQVWKDHLLTLDHLRQGINLRAYAQSNPLNEYKREAFSLFQEMMERLKENVITALAHFEIQTPDMSIFDRLLDEEFVEGDEVEGHFPTLSEEADAIASQSVEEAAQKPKRKRAKKQEDSSIDPNDPSTWTTVSRNALCPCGSGKRYKQCHGAIEA